METKFSHTRTIRNWVKGLKSLQDLQLMGEFGSAGNRSWSVLLYVARAALGWLVVVIPWAYFHRWPRYDRQIALMLIQMKSKWTSACTGEGGLIFLSTCTSQGTKGPVPRLRSWRGQADNFLQVSFVYDHQAGLSAGTIKGFQPNEHYFLQTVF